MSAQSDKPANWRRTLGSLFAHEPIRHARWEIIILRLAIALLVWDNHTMWIGFWDQPVQAVQQMTINVPQNDLRFDAMPHPNGFGAWFDLTVLSRDEVEQPLRIATGISLLLYVLGIPAAFSLALPTIFTIGVAALNNSQGTIGHIAQGLHLALLCMWFAGIWSFVCKRRGRPLPWQFTPGQLEMDWARQAVMATYVVSAITKLINSNGLWFATARYFPLGLVKNNDMEFYDTLNPDALRLDWLPQVLMEHPTLCEFFFGIALPLELFAFLGLYNRRIAVAFGLGLIVFHETVTQLTHLSFVFNKLLLLLLFVNVPWWICRGIKKVAAIASVPPAKEPAGG